MFNKTMGIGLCAFVLAGALGLAGTSAANAESAMAACGAQWKAAKAAGTTGGKTWPEFRSQCLAEQKAAPAPAPTAVPVTPAPATAPAPAPTTYVAPKATAPMATGGKAGHNSRIHECAAEWKQAKATNSTNGLKWPQFWHQCDVRLKAEAR